MDGQYKVSKHKKYNASDRARSHQTPGYQYLSRENYLNMDDTMEQSYTDYPSCSTKYLDYPATKPFINSEYTRPNTQFSSHVATDRDAVITALRQLQDKINNLEIERKAAERNLHSLTSETQQYKQILSAGEPRGSSGAHQRYSVDKESDVLLGHSRELEGQLSSAEHRCQRLEKQLIEMRKLVKNSERNQHELLEQIGKTQQEKDLAGLDIREHMDRLNELERDQTQLTVTQTLAESKIRELENKIRKEKYHREKIQEKTTKLESETPKEVLINMETPPPKDEKVLRTKKSTKKKKRSPSTHLTAGKCKPEPKRHYRLNLAEIPFVAGKSTGPSHALGANVQKVLAMMKLHNSALCSQAHTNGDCQRSESRSSTGSSVASIEQDLNDLLAQLQDEFGQLSSKHQEIVDLIHLTRDPRTKEKLKQELDTAVTNIDTKSQQIFTIRQHQKKAEDAKQIKSREAKISAKTKRILAQSSHPHHHHHLPSHSKIPANRNRPKPQVSTKPIGHSALGRPELFMLRDMKKLQKNLQRDDLSWE